MKTILENTVSYLKLKRIGFFVIALFLLIGGSTANAQTVKSAMDHFDTEFGIDVKKVPIFPSRLKEMGIDEGSVRLVLEVSDTGRLVDWIIVEASHRDFARSVESVIDSWNFTAPLIGDVPQALAVYVDVEFTIDGPSVINPDMGAVMHLAYNLPQISEFETIRVHSIQEVDLVPEPIYVEKPIVPKELVSNGPQKVIFEFFIDTDGNVHIPILRNQDTELDEQVLIIAQEALREWKFSPATVNRRPVIVRVAQPLVFGES